MMKNLLIFITVILSLLAFPAFAQNGFDPNTGFPFVPVYALANAAGGSFKAFMVGDPMTGLGQPTAQGQIDIFYRTSLSAVPNAVRASFGARANCHGFGVSIIQATYFDSKDALIKSVPAGVQPYPNSYASAIRGMICSATVTRGPTLPNFSGSSVLDLEKSNLGWNVGH